MSSFHNVPAGSGELGQLGRMLCPSPPLGRRADFALPGGTGWMGSLPLDPAVF